jgi:hypothetical protein
MSRTTAFLIDQKAAGLLEACAHPLA